MFSAFDFSLSIDFGLFLKDSFKAVKEVILLSILAISALSSVCFGVSRLRVSAPAPAVARATIA